MTVISAPIVHSMTSIEVEGKFPLELAPLFANLTKKFKDTDDVITYWEKFAKNQKNQVHNDCVFKVIGVSQRFFKSRCKAFEIECVARRETRKSFHPKKFEPQFKFLIRVFYTKG